MIIRFLLSLLLVFFFGTPRAQTIKLKTGQKFSYESINNYDSGDKWHHWKEYRYLKTNFEVIGHLDSIYTLKASPEVIIMTDHYIIRDSTLPYDAQPGDFMAIAYKVLTQSSYELRINEAGAIIDVIGIADIKDKILSKLKELQIGDGDEPHQKLAETNIDNRFLKELSSFFSSPGQIPDPSTGLILQGENVSNKTYLTSNGSQAFRYNLDKFKLIPSDGKPGNLQTAMVAEAKKVLNYDDYYTPMNKVKHRIQEMADIFSRENVSQIIKTKLIKELDSLDNIFGENNNEYLAAKLVVLPYVGHNYRQVLRKVSYEYLPNEYVIPIKMVSELDQGDLSNVKKAVQLSFTKNRREGVYPMNMVGMSRDVHNEFGGLIYRIKNRDSLQNALMIIKQIEELEIPAATELLKGLKTYVRAKLAIEQDELAEIAGTNFNSVFDKAVRYRILIYDQLVKKQVPLSLRQAYIDKTIDLIQKRINEIETETVDIDVFTFESEIKKDKVVYQKNLADAYYRKSRLQRSTESAYLQKAAASSPSLQSIIDNKERLRAECNFMPFVDYNVLR